MRPLWFATEIAGEEAVHKVHRVHIVQKGMDVMDPMDFMGERDGYPAALYLTITVGPPLREGAAICRATRSLPRRLLSTKSLFSP